MSNEGMILLKWIYGTRHLAVAISDRLFKQGGGGGRGAARNGVRD